MTNKPLTRQELVDECVRFYSASHDANGIPVAAFLGDGRSLSEVKTLITDAVKKDEIEVVFAETDENPHIRRLPAKLKKPFNQIVDSCDLTQACLYPSKRIISEKVDLGRFVDSPYTLQLWQGKAQLEFVFFDLKVLLTYHSDPRYTLGLGSLGGNLSTNDDSLPESDRVYVQDLAVAYTEDGTRVLAVLLRYLCGLSPAHQRIWYEYERKDRCKVNELSLNASYFGQWPEATSIYEALTQELKIINQICTANFGKAMFRSDFSDSKPEYYHVLLIPTEREYRNFARALDLLISENLNKDFFASFQRIADQIKKDKLGTIGSLKLWLRTHWKPREGDPVSDISKGIELVRKERSVPAHKSISNAYDIAYTEKQKELISQAYVSVRNLRLILQNLPKSNSISIPDWLNGRIVNP